MKTTKELLTDFEDAKKRIAELETITYAAEETIGDLRNKIEVLKDTHRKVELEEAKVKTVNAQIALDTLRNWLDKNYSFVTVEDGEAVIVTPFKRVWYFATDRIDLYPMSQVPK